MNGVETTENIDARTGIISSLTGAWSYLSICAPVPIYSASAPPSEWTSTSTLPMHAARSTGVHTV